MRRPRPVRCRQPEASRNERVAGTAAIVKPAEPWRQRLIRSLLYGRNVDRAAKARARVGFAIVAFAAVYAVIGGRLVMYAVGADSHGAPRWPSQDAIATARPDIVDRNGEILATDVKAPACSPNRAGSSTRTRRSNSDRDAARSRARRGARAPAPRKGFVWLKREINAEQQQRDPSPRHSRHRLPAREQARLSDRRRSSRT